ncbi:amino acid ABC transporter permease [Rhizobium altiplani]|uniref:Amino acid ABC transporter permease n=1 Tax=Rhizobium altiplani TaxID=1864509 RepID=A0A109JMU3_9HYPH|nr:MULTISPECIES: branched-chain amino acid ABC transporter permease [Rhizobium]KWV51998.1 amino acid ABC transporter permease [Rhizobium altiplani]
MNALEIINYHLIPGLVIGTTYALGAIGVTLVFAIMRHGHIAHGDMSALGAFIALLVVTSLGISPYAALPLAMVFGGLVAVGIDQVFYGPLRAQPKLISTMASFGVALIIRSLIQMYWGVQTQVYNHGISRPTNWLGMRLKPQEIMTFVITIGIIVALQLFLNRSKWGKAMRAMSDNPDLAGACGVDIRKVTVLTWLLVGALCAASGFFLGINTELKSTMGWNILLPVFAAAILGGVGRIEGAAVGGLIVGLAEEFSVLFLPAEYKAVCSFAILLIVLLLRPTGIFNGKVL